MRRRCASATSRCAADGRTSGEHWHFYATDLAPGRRYPLSLAGGDGRALCQPWELATFPGPDERPSLFRLLIYSCAGGHEAFTFLPPAVRNRLLRRGLSFEPNAAVANGDHVYWDLLSPFDSHVIGGRSPQAEKLAGKFDRSGVVIGGDNENVLNRAAGPQIMPVYGPPSARRRYFSCRTITTISTTTRRPTRSSRSRLRISCSSSRAPRRNSTTRSSCRTWRDRSACRGLRRAIGRGECPRVSAPSATADWPRFFSMTFAAARRWPGRARSMSISRWSGGSRRVRPRPR